VRRDRPHRSAATGSEEMIRCVGLLKVYESPSGRVQAVRGVDLSIGRGRSVAVVGPSGSGKSSLLRLVSGIDDPTAGDVIVDGINISRLSSKDRRMTQAAKLSHVFQRPSDNLLEHLTVAEQVERVARARRAERGAVDDLLERLELVERSGHLPSQLSGGEQQRVAFARAAVGDPAVIIADEPTAELDAVSTARILDTIDELSRRGITILVATHDPLVLAHIDEIVMLRDGAVASVTRGGTELAVIDGAGRLQLPLAVRSAFSEGRARMTWDPVREVLTVEAP